MLTEIEPAPERRRDAAATRAAILAAARAAFTRHGYEGTGVREVAAAAGVNAALVNRYFGSKEGLFVAAVTHPMALPELLAGERASAGERLAHFVLTKPKPVGGDHCDPLIMLLRSSPEGPAAELFRQLMAEHLLEPLADWLGGERAAERAEVIAAHMVGLVVTRNVLHLKAIESNPQAIISLAGKAIQALIDQSELL